MKKHVTVFGSGKITSDGEEYKTAYETGRLLAKSGYIHVSGGYGGTMEAGAKGAREAQGKTIGVTIKDWGPPNIYTDQNFQMNNLYERLERLLSLGDAYIVLPGATGTVIEFSLAWERRMKGLSVKKPIIVIGDFWIPVINVIKSKIDQTKGEIVTRPDCLYGDFMFSADTPSDAIHTLNTFFSN